MLGGDFSSQHQSLATFDLSSSPTNAVVPRLPQLADLSLDGLASGEGLSTLAHLTSLAIAPAQGARISLHGLPRLQRLVCDLGSSGSSGRELLSERASVHVPAAGHGLASLSQLELRCFVWRHWEADGGSEDGGSDGSSSEDGSGSGSEGGDGDASSAAGSEAASSSGGSSGWEEEEQDDATSSGSSSSDGGSGGSGSAESSSMAGSEAMDEMAVDGWEAEEVQAAEDGGAAAHGAEEGWQEEEEQQAAGLLEASWGFMQRGRNNSGAASAQGVPAIVSLEQRCVCLGF